MGKKSLRRSSIEGCPGDVGAMQLTEECRTKAHNIGHGHSSGDYILIAIHTTTGSSHSTYWHASSPNKRGTRYVLEQRAEYYERDRLQRVDTSKHA